MNIKQNLIYFKCFELFRNDYYVGSIILINFFWPIDECPESVISFGNVVPLASRANIFVQNIVVRNTRAFWLHRFCFVT
jgi:hypothetical protein